MSLNKWEKEREGGKGESFRMGSRLHDNDNGSMREKGGEQILGDAWGLKEWSK